MPSVSHTNLGPLIAYLIPGATVLWGLSLFSPELRSLFISTPVNAPTIGGFLYLTVASLAVGMTVTAIRWALIDRLHAITGLPPPNLDFSRLKGQVDAFNVLVEHQYRHYQFYSNMVVATAIAYTCYRLHLGTPWQHGLPDLTFVCLEAVFLVTSRDTLEKYYRRSAQLLGQPSTKSETKRR